MRVCCRYSGVANKKSWSPLNFARLLYRVMDYYYYLPLQQPLVLRIISRCGQQEKKRNDNK